MTYVTIAGDIETRSDAGSNTKDCFKLCVAAYFR
jgi:hypothetical protein